MESMPTAWPAWLVKLDPELENILAALDQQRKWLIERTSEPFVYKRLARAQVRQFEELGEKTGAFRQYADGKRANFDILTKLQVPSSLLRAMVFNTAQLRHTLDAYRYTKKLVCQKLVEEIPVVIQAADFFSGLSVMKALYENLGDMALLTRSLSAVKPEGHAHQALEQYDAILSKELGSGVDWIKLMQADLRQVEDLQTVQTFADRERDDAHMTRKAITELERRMKSIAAVYPVLSELVSPRVGTLWMVYEDSEPVTDAHKTQWNRNKIGPDFPRVMVEKMTPLVVQLFGVLNESLGLLKALDKELEEVAGRIDTAVRDETRTWLWKFPDLFADHENCPCGSGKRVKYCCAQ